MSDFCATEPPARLRAKVRANLCRTKRDGLDFLPALIPRGGVEATASGSVQRLSRTASAANSRLACFSQHSLGLPRSYRMAGRSPADQNAAGQWATTGASVVAEKGL